MIIMEYARNYNTLTDEQATKLIHDYATLDHRINLRGAYVKQFGGVPAAQEADAVLPDRE
jgi:hypothetical protein